MIQKVAWDDNRIELDLNLYVMQYEMQCTSASSYGLDSCWR